MTEDRGMVCIGPYDITIDELLMGNEGRGKKKLDITQICYVEVQDHLLLYHTTEGSFATKGTIRDAESQLDAKSFFRCNRCYLVNLEYVDNYMGSDVSVNGDTIQVSRSRRKPFLDALNEYLNEVGK